MKTIIKSTHLLIFYFLIIVIAIIQNPARADLLLNPTIVVKANKLCPDCHNYTGCSVTVIKRKYIYRSCHSNNHCRSCRPC